MLLLEDIGKFLDAGGPVLLVIALLLLVMWTLIFERVWYFRTVLRNDIRVVLDYWETRAERRSVRAHQIREALISRVALKLNRNLSLIRALMTVAPGDGDRYDRCVPGIIPQWRW